MEGARSGSLASIPNGVDWLLASTPSAGLPLVSALHTAPERNLPVTLTASWSSFRLRSFCAVASLAFLAGIAASAVPADAATTILAAAGGPVPGGGTFGTSFGVPVIDNAGEVAFSGATVPQPGGAEIPNVYRGTSAATLAAITHGAVGVTISRLVALNDNHIVVFTVNGGEEIDYANGSVVQTVARSTDDYRPTTNSPFTPLGTLNTPVLNRNNQVAFTCGGGALFVDGELAAYVGQGDPQTGQVHAFAGPVAVLPTSGGAVFLGDSTSNAQQFPSADVMTGNSTNGIVDFLVPTGQPFGSDDIAIAIPGTSTPMISDAGIVFATATSSTIGQGDDSALFLVQGSNVQAIARGGDPAPGGGTFAKIVGTNEYLPFEEPQINNAGSIVFTAYTDNGPGLGVYRFTQAHGIEAMALQGHAPFAAAAGFRNAVINEHDVVAFQAFDNLGPNRRGVYVTDGTDLVYAGQDYFFGAQGLNNAANDDSYYPSPHDGMSPLNDRGTVTFVQSTGGTAHESVAKFTIDPTWRKATGGSWDVADNWTFALAPDAESHVQIFAEKAAGPLVVTGPAAPTTVTNIVIGRGTAPFDLGVPELDLQSGGPLTMTSSSGVVHGKLGGTGSFQAPLIETAPNGTIDGDLALTGEVINAGTMGGTFTVTGEVGNVGTLGGTGTINGKLTNENVVDADLIVNGDVFNDVGASIKGNYTFNGTVTNLGTISPGHSPGSVHVTGDLTLQTQAGDSGVVGSELDIEIGGPNPGDFDVIDVTGTATLAGTLKVSFINGFVPAAGQQFAVLTASHFAGAFDTILGGNASVTANGLLVTAPANATTSPKARLKCASGIAKAGSTYASARVKAIAACTNALGKCTQESPDADKRAACFDKEGAACDKAIAKVIAAGTKLGATIDKACGAVAVGDLLPSVGIGFETIGSACSTSTAAVTTTWSEPRCRARASSCGSRCCRRPISTFSDVSRTSAAMKRISERRRAPASRSPRARSRPRRARPPSSGSN